MEINSKTLLAPAFVSRLETTFSRNRSSWNDFSILSCITEIRNYSSYVFAEDLFNASIINKSSIKLSFAGLDVD